MSAPKVLGIVLLTIVAVARFADGRLLLLLLLLPLISAGLVLLVAAIPPTLIAHPDVLSHLPEPLVTIALFVLAYTVAFAAVSAVTRSDRTQGGGP